MPSTPAPGALPPARIRGAVRGTYIAFAGCGLAFSSWASRLPQVRDHLHLSPARLGLVLLAIAAGSLIALPLAGPLIHRAGTRNTVACMSLLLCVGLSTVAVGYPHGTLPVVVGLFLLGLGTGAWDVAMNVHGALVEKHLGRSIMSRFHAGYSLGTVAGALIGAGMVALHVPVTVHLVLAAAVIALAVPWGTRSFLRDDAPLDDGPDEPAPAPRGPLAAWREPRTLLIGVFVLAFAFAEGTGNDWIGIATIDGYGTSALVGTLSFATFLATMTLGRWFGPMLLDRHGRVPVLRVLAAFGIAGALLFVFAPATPLAFLGTVLWGLGVSLGFPVGMSAGADEPRYAAGRVSVIASIGYCAFLAGPPSIGLLADHLTTLRALTSVAVLLGVAALITSAVTPPRGVVASSTVPRQEPADHDSRTAS
ncbi:putative transcriptional regulator [Actinacidiphila reveromycinica]|uniref:Putative transcriptional regulator n=1 Tax=Actinacidiphila reveromycinica TaxID=659352 RepID=A0A7U3VLK8_9ACTN|nr:MFS transporter [Streptomyces sp. SN-593]BBA95659.1 putative transcriptional regulator [Streptomyces sp. SN-593]